MPRESAWPFDHDLRRGPALHPVGVLLQRRLRIVPNLRGVEIEERVGQRLLACSADRASCSRRPRPRSAARRRLARRWRAVAAAAPGWCGASAAGGGGGRRGRCGLLLRARAHADDGGEGDRANTRTPRLIWTHSPAAHNVEFRKVYHDGSSARGHRARRTRSLLVPWLPAVRRTARCRRRPWPRGSRSSTAAAAPGTTWRMLRRYGRAYGIDLTWAGLQYAREKVSATSRGRRRRSCPSRTPASTW